MKYRAPSTETCHIETNFVRKKFEFCLSVEIRGRHIKVDDFSHQSTDSQFVDQINSILYFNGVTVHKAMQDQKLGKL